jgi:CHAT domain-containing protein
MADEAVHITAAFHLAGYRRVIGTLWPINDSAAARIATDVYTHLTGAGTHPPYIEDSAHALAEAVRHLRDDHPALPTHWAAHVHFGA